jgi:vacuolar-type H+-ATPase subunit I/STV1
MQVSAPSVPALRGKYMMDENLMNEAISKAVRVAISVYEEKKQELLLEQRKQNLLTIKEILKKYHIFKKYLSLDEAKVELSETADDIGYSQTDREIKQRIMRFDKSLKILESICKSLGQTEYKRCYQIICDLYIEEPLQDQQYLQGEDKFSAIAEKYNINKRTVYKDIDKASNILSYVYFGILD